MRIPFAQKILAISIVLVACLLEAAAQGTRTLQSVGRRIDTLNRQAQEYERDNMNRDAKEKNSPEAAKRSRQIRLEIEEDLNALQNAYNNTVTAMQTGKDLRPGFAAETARVVRKHAHRLRDNLALPSSDGKEEKTGPPPLPDNDRKTLTALCRVIYELVTNPMFEGTGSLEVKNRAKARLDLDAIIRLAEHLSDVAEIATR